MAVGLNIMPLRGALLVACFSLCLSFSFPAAEPIVVQLSDGSQVKTAKFTSLVRALDSLQRAPEAYFGDNFSSANDYTGTLSIFGFPISLTVTGTAVTFSFVDAGGHLVKRSFDGGNRAVSWHLFRLFFQGETGDDLQGLLESIQKNAVYNFISGPQSSIGQSVRQNVLYGLGNSFVREADEALRSGKQRLSLSAAISYDDFSVGEYSGESYSVPINFRFGLDRNVRMRIGVPLTRTIVEGMEFTRYGAEVDMSLHLRDPRTAQGLSWVVTPVIGIYETQAPELYHNSTMYTYGVWTRLEEDYQNARLAYVFYYGNFGSTDGVILDSEAETGIEEQVIAHALKLDLALGDNWMLDLYGMDTRSIAGEGYRDTRTYGGGVSFHEGRSRSPLRFRLGLALDHSKEDDFDYDSLRYECGLKFRF